jgi:hypothetical protein
VGVVEHCPVQSEFDAVGTQQVSVEDLRVANLGSDGVADALLLTTFCDVRIVRVSQQDPYSDAGLGLLAEDPLEAGIFSQEEARIDEDADLRVSGLEQVLPVVSGHVRAVRVDAHELALRQGGGAVLRQGIRPQVRLVTAQPDRQAVAVAWEWHDLPADPAFDGLDVDSELLRECMMGQALFHHGGSQSFVRHES